MKQRKNDTDDKLKRADVNKRAAEREEKKVDP